MSQIPREKIDEFEFALHESWVEWFRREPGINGYRRFINQKLVEEMTVIQLVRAALGRPELMGDPDIYHKMGWIVDWHESLLYRRWFVASRSLGLNGYKLDKKRAELLDSVVGTAKGDIRRGLLLLRTALKYVHTGYRAAAYWANNRHIAQLAYMAYMREEDEIKVVDDALQFMGVARPDRAGMDMLDFNTLVPIFFDFFQPPEAADDGGPKLEAPEWERVATVDELRQLGKKMAVVGLWREVLLVPVDGGVAAYENWCTHERDPLHYGYIQGKQLVCLGHHATFDVRTGRVILHPNHGEVRVLPKYQVKVEEGVVYVRVPW
jgi:nitrite reductase/ring-hydroxylating ferredoxin subunit